MVYSIDEIKNKLNKIDIPQDIQKIYLFGSYARNEATDKSDMDFYVEYDNVVDWECYIIADTFEDLFNKRIDLLVQNDLRVNEFLKNNIYNERKLIYERKR